MISPPSGCLMRLGADPCLRFIVAHLEDAAGAVASVQPEVSRQFEVLTSHRQVDLLDLSLVESYAGSRATGVTDRKIAGECEGLSDEFGATPNITLQCILARRSVDGA